MIRTSIQVKSGLLVFISSLVLAGAILCTGYFHIWKLRYQMMGERQVLIAEMLSRVITTKFLDHTAHIELSMGNQLWQGAVREQNARYQTLVPDAILRELMDLDQRWPLAGDNDPLIAGILNSEVSQRLREMAHDDRDIAEIFFTDKFGGLVASSGRTSDYYQADEAWWQRANKMTPGEAYLGEIEYDESSRIMSSAIAMPMRDKDGQVLGVIKVVLDISAFLAPAAQFKFGETGHVALVDESGQVIVGHQSTPLSQKLLEPSEMTKFLGHQKHYGGMLTLLHKTVSFSAYARFDDPLFADNQIKWLTVVSQDRDEIIGPLNRFFMWMIMFLAALMALVVGTYQFLMRKIFLNPITSIHRGAERLAMGDLEHVIEISTGDELESLTDTLNMMSRNLRQTMVSRDQLLLEIDERKRTEERLLEKKNQLMASQAELREMFGELEKSHEELKSAHDQLVQSEKMAAVGQLSAGIAHEIKNPIAVMLMALGSIDTQWKDMDEKTRSKFEMIKNAAERMEKIVKGLLSFSRASAGKYELVNVNEVIKSAIAVTESLAKVRRIFIRTQFCPDQWVMADMVLLQQVLVNIIHNAMDAINGEGAIEIITDIPEGTPDKLRLRIRDSGPGIPAELLTKIFAPFFTTKGPEQGTGLGLSMADSIIKGHKGTISAENLPEGGAVFTIILPVQKPV